MNTPSGVSNAVQSTTDGTWTVYGGIQLNVGPSNYSGCSTSGTCNTCVGADPINGVTDGPCNPNGVFTTTQISFSASTDVADVANAKWMLCSGTNQIKASTTLGKTGTVTPTWSELCQGLKSDSTCATGFSSSGLYLGYGTDCSTLSDKISLTIAVRPVDVTTQSNYVPCPGGTTTGVAGTGGGCSYKLFPGDKKAWLETSDYYTYGTDTGISNVTYDTVFFFFKEGVAGADGGTFSSITTDYANSAEIPLSGQDIQTNSYISDLTNDSHYCFRMATQDTAKNIDMMAPTGSIYVCNTGATDCPDVCVTPSEVVGLLSDKHCFIATAAFGSDMDKHVQELRNFRNEFMAPYWLGRKLVKTYYALSPPLARWISKHETARTFTRGMLWPILGWAELSLRFGWAVVISPFLLVGLLIFFHRRKKRMLKV